MPPHDEIGGHHQTGASEQRLLEHFRIVRFDHRVHFIIFEYSAVAHRPGIAPEHKIDVDIGIADTEFAKQWRDHVDAERIGTRHAQRAARLARLPGLMRP